MSVDSLLNLNGVHGTQVFTDDGLNPVSWSASSAKPTLSTTEKKFGLSSLFFDGDTNAKGIQANGINFGNNSSVYTMEGWFRTSTIATDYQGLLTNNPTTVGLFIRFDNLIWYQAGDKILNSFVLEINTWYHFSLVRELSIISLFINGIRLGSVAYTLDDTASSIVLGSQNTIPSYPLIGYIDDFRYTPNEILYNFLSRPDNIQQTELTTTPVQPPTIPTDHSILTPDFLVSPATGITIGVQGATVLGGGSGGGVEPTPDPTSTNIISGNVSKLGLPYGATVACVSLGVNAEIVGTGVSDGVTGDYSIDVYPHISEVLIYVAPDYGNLFEINTTISEGQIIHPTIPNRYVYICTIAGTTGTQEPVWGTQGLINSGSVTFSTLPLHRPLMNGFIKPVITPI